MRKYELDPDLRDDRPIADRVHAVALILDEVLAKSAGRLNARWRLKGDDRTHPIVVLNLSDWNYPAGVETGFSPDELSDSRRFRERIRDIHGDLLSAQLQKSVSDLMALPVDGVAP